MILHIHSDASYLSETQACSRAGGHHYLSNQPLHKPPPPNGPILNIAKIICHVMSSASEAELGALFLNVKEGTVLSPPHHSKWTLPLQTGSSMEHANNDSPERSTCGSIGSATELNKVTSTSSGPLALTTWLIILQNIIRQLINRRMRPIIFNDPKHHHFLQGCVNAPSQPKVTRRFVCPSYGRHQKPMTSNHTSRARQ
jgi:hypothetical protein